MWQFNADVSLRAGGPGWRSRLRRAWNADLWVGRVPLVKLAAAAGAFAAGLLGW